MAVVRDDIVKLKGGPACPYHIRVEINLACFDLWRLLHLQTCLIADSNQRGTPVNRRFKELGNIHMQYDQIDARFMRRVESLELEKGQQLDLARRLTQAQGATNSGGVEGRGGRGSKTAAAEPTR
jgi:hypothetical protein